MTQWGSVEQMKSLQEPCHPPPQTGSKKPSESCDSLENAAPEYSESMAQLQSPRSVDRGNVGDQEENDSEALVLPDVRPHHESSTLSRSQDHDVQAEENLPVEDGTSPQEQSTETIQEEPGDQEAPEFQQDGNNHVAIVACTSR